MSIVRDTTNKLYNFASSLVGNRVFDLYLKYMGIKTLTTATLVPVALLLGQQQFEKFIRKAQQTGGADIPVVDDPLVGNILKAAGLTTMSFTPNTLVPLGILMLVYELTRKNEIQTGGNIGKYVKRIYGNRVMDLFLKYNGLKMLTSTTLVPFALLYGKDYLESTLKGEQTGGALPSDIPIIDDPLLGNYLKLAGLSLVSLTPNTLVPLGVLMAIYHIYYEQQ